MRHEPIEQWDRRRRGVGVRLDITNVRSGKLVGVKPVSRTQFATIVWPCQCDCGNTTHVVASLIARGITRSCGCANDRRRERDSAGRFQKRARAFAGRDSQNASGESIGRKG